MSVGWGTVHNLLTTDGVIFISIDENEVNTLKAICDEVFGASNFIAELIWSAGRKNDSKYISISHEYILCYFKDALWVKEHKQIRVNSSVKYDLVVNLVRETGLTRKAVVEILTGIEKAVFDQFKDNPEEFILKAAALINDEKATAIIQHITYNVLDEHYDTDIFTEPTIKGKLGTNAMKAQRHLYDHIVYDSTNERDFATDLDTNTDVAVYVKLPDSFYIATPVGHYNPDWAIAFYKGTVKHIYFVAETKGSLSSMQLRLIEESKIHCAREHFKAISNGNVIYDVVDSYQTLLEKVMK